MKRITAKIFASFVLIFGIVFGGLSIFTPLLSSEVYALPGDNDNNTSEDINAPDDTNPTPDTPDTPADAEDTDTNPSQPADGEEQPADGENQPTDEENPTESEATPESEAPANICTDQAGALSWIVCPATKLIAGIVDTIYSLINDLLVVQPISMDDASPIYIIWQYVLTLTNIVFVIFLLIVIFSQVTGLGISNYGVKRVLPKLIIAVILMNLSYHICALAVDVSNIAGSSFREFFAGIKNTVLTSVGENTNVEMPSFDSIIGAVMGGSSAIFLAVGATGGVGHLFWMLVLVLIGAVVSVATGLITIAARQAVIALLIMISPLAFAAYLLPNTEKWFTQWKNLLFRMLIFYPAFSFLYGASELVGWAIISSANNGFGVILGLAVQVFPLFFSWSLMKMSGTILGTFNDALRRVAKPVQDVGSRWAMEHAEQKAQNYIGKNDNSTGARLRQYLDYRRTLRLNDTKNAADIRQDRATERAMKTSASVIDRDEKGNMRWTINPNRYARTAKSASYHHTLAANATAIYQNTLSGYGRHFTDSWSTGLSGDHAQAFADSMAQQFLAANEAEADQKWLLDQYLDAKAQLKHNSYQYNRLIKDAAGGLGHNGESSIMGQVIIGNSNIENRRRTEGRVMINKFGMEKHKQELRGMIFDKEHINDEGFATDEFNNPIEDDQYNLLPGKKYTPWQRYIGVHKVTGEEITKEQYDALSESERANWTKIRYFDIKDDQGNDVQRIFEDDAGYMKEILSDDVYISDPIVRRFSTQIGVDADDHSKDGILRRYHSTIRTAIDGSGFSKGHGAAYTQMYTSAANAGLIRGMGHHNIILLQSFAASSKPGNFFQQDSFFIEELDKLMGTAANPETFAHYFPDEYVNTATTNNGVPINGMRLVTTTNEKGESIPEWEEVNFHDLEQLDPKTALEYRKNYIKHKMIPKAITVAVGFLERKLSPEAVNALKPGAKKKLDAMRERLSDIGVMNLNEDIPFTERPDGRTNLFEVPDTNSSHDGVVATQEYIKEAYGIVSAPKPTATTVGQSSNKAIYHLGKQIERSKEADMRIQQYNDMMDILQALDSYHDNATRGGFGLDVFCEDVLSLFEERPRLRGYLGDCDVIVAKYRNMPHATRGNFINQITNADEEFEHEQIEHIYREIKDLVYRACNTAN